MYKKILLAYDGSAPADKAFAHAVDLATRYQASLDVIAVARIPEFGDDVETEAILENSQKHYEKVLAPLKEQIASQGMRACFEIAVGHPAEQIIYYAEKNDVDLIVMGHRGKTFFDRWRLGSVSKQVIHYAHCDVLVVR